MDILALSIHSSPLGQLGTRDTGGMSVYLLETAKRIGQLGHRIDIFTLKNNTQTIPNIYELSENVRLVSLAVESGGKLTKENLFEYLPMVYAAYQRQHHLLDREYDLIHSHYWLSGQLGIMIQKEFQLPHYVTFHTLGKVKNLACKDENEPNLRIVHEKKLAAECSVILAFTQEEKENLVTYYDALPGKIGIVPCGVDYQLFKPVRVSRAELQVDLEPEDKLLLYVGRTVPIKGIDKLLEAIAMVADEYPVKCILVGGDDEILEGVIDLQKRIDELFLGGKVIGIGNIKQEELVRYYCAADALVVPSLHESFCLVALEALACGTPVIGSAVGILPQVINRNNGFLVTAGDEHELAEAIKQIILKKTPRLKDRAGIRQTIVHYSWDRVAGRLLAIYTSDAEDLGGK